MVANGKARLIATQMLARLAPLTANAPQGAGSGLPASLSELSQRCALQRDRITARKPDPLRLIHHFACTGGTLMSRALAAQPNTLMLSEMDPLSPGIKAQKKFAPGDILQMATMNREALSPDTKIAVFRAGLEALYLTTTAGGRHVIVRDHTHSHFCATPAPDTRPLISQMLRPTFDLRSVITVRHPLDSYIALRLNNWVGHAVRTLNTYAARYGLFLDSYPDVPVFYYEDFVTDPDAICQQMAQALELEYNPGWRDILPAIALSGDSGRRSDTIGHRPRRPVSQDLIREIEKGAPDYERLCQRLGYDPDPEGSGLPDASRADPQAG